MTEKHFSPDSEVQISYDLAREDKDLTVATICRVFENGFKVLAHLQGEDAEAFIDAWNARGAPAQGVPLTVNLDPVAHLGSLKADGTWGTAPQEPIVRVSHIEYIHQPVAPQCACGRPLECPECVSLRAEPQAAQEPPLAKMLKEVNPELAKVLSDNAAYVQAIRNNVIDECAKALERSTPGYVSCESQFSNGYYQGREDAVKEIRALSRPQQG